MATQDVFADKIINTFKGITTNTELIKLLKILNKKCLTDDMKLYLFKRYINTNDKEFGRTIIELMDLENEYTKQTDLLSEYINIFTNPTDNFIKLLVDNGADIFAKNQTDYIIVNNEENNQYLTEYLELFKSLNLDFDRAIELIKLGVDVNTKITDEKGIETTLLHKAISTNGIYVNDIIKLGADVDATNCKVNPLYLAIYTNKTDIAKVLIDAGAEINYDDNKYSSLLFTAILTHNYLNVKLLIKAGADIFAKNKADVSILKYAKEREANGIITYLQGVFTDKYYEELKKSDPDFELLILLMKEYDVKPNLIITFNSEPFNCNGILCEAVKRNRIDLIDRILELGVDINSKIIDTRINREDSALQLAVYLNNNDTVDKLIKAGADVNAKINYRGGLIIHDAIKRGYPKIIKILLNAGADLTCVSEDKNLIKFVDHYLYASAYCSRSEITKLIKDKLNKQLIQEINNPEVNIEYVCKLLNSGADINIQNGNGDSILHKAVMINDGKLLQIVFDKNIDLNIKNLDGDTALSLAIKYNYRDIIINLLEEYSFKNKIDDLVDMSKIKLIDIIKYLMEKL